MKQRGIDAATIDSRFEKKAAVAHYSGSQEIEIEAVRAELTKLEHKLREANEMELPEEEFRAAVDSKRDELAVLMKKYANTEDSSTRFDRSQRSHRAGHQDHHRRAVGQDEDDGAFVNFTSNRRRDHGYDQFEENQY